MPLAECPNKHFYNATKYGDTCNVCGAKVKKDREKDMTQEEIEAELRILERDYVCGWLVCVEGLNKGRSYPLHKGKNFIGSGDDMDVQILGDDEVNLYRHGVLVYDEKKVEFMLLPGESVGLVYIKKNAVYSPQKLEAYDVIEVGKSTLIFVPLCGEHYAWK